MNAQQAMWQAGKMAAMQGTRLLNMLCRKCRMKYVKALTANSKIEGAKKSDDFIKNKEWKNILCDRCKRRMDAVSMVEA